MLKSVAPPPLGGGRNIFPKEGWNKVATVCPLPPLGGGSGPSVLTSQRTSVALLAEGVG